MRFSLAEHTSGTSGSYASFDEASGSSGKGAAVVQPELSEEAAGLQVIRMICATVMNPYMCFTTCSEFEKTCCQTLNLKRQRFMIFREM